jgi:hypothetical protein
LFDFIDNQPSAPVVWFTVVAAIIGLIIGMPALLYKTWGRPRIEFRFDVEDMYEATWLNVHIRNLPLRNSLAHFLDIVRRPVQEASILLRVYDAATRSDVFGSVPSVKMSAGSSAQKFSLPPSFLGVEFWIIRQMEGELEVVGMDDKIGRQVLVPGTYRADVFIDFDGRDKKAQCEFVVTPEGFYLSGQTRPTGHFYRHGQ